MKSTAKGYCQSKFLYIMVLQVPSNTLFALPRIWQSCGWDFALSTTTQMSNITSPIQTPMLAQYTRLIRFSSLRIQIEIHYIRELLNLHHQKRWE